MLSRAHRTSRISPDCTQKKRRTLLKRWGCLSECMAIIVAAATNVGEAPNVLAVVQMKAICHAGAVTPQAGDR